MKYAKKMDVLVADLAVLNIKLHNLHWNVVGEQFVPLHNFTQSLYEEAFEDFDAVAEAMKMAGKSPAATMKEYIEITKIKELTKTSFTTGEVLKNVLADIKYITKSAEAIRTDAAKEDDFSVVQLMEGIISRNKKHIWFVESMSK